MLGKRVATHNVDELIKLTDTRYLVKIIEPMFIVTCEGQFDSIYETKPEAQIYIDGTMEDLRDKLEIVEFNELEIRKK